MRAERISATFSLAFASPLSRQLLLILLSSRVTRCSVQTTAVRPVNRSRVYFCGPLHDNNIHLKYVKANAIALKKSGQTNEQLQRILQAT
ncbi:uncharacterized protein PHACADRAFT_256443 [Phanerochaete carnosa HHB-10118-sp]|uniref:Secreted protein n=1 Tax=Phanerochaete carnosa (strain HHB-10118-sp) TaxID=650164 RepID=K5WYS7_PHACS|nr:uncharacterized protein PHACADRAFT_256443 [Phanerochaete carnosa HHB-10118-sp]EKM55662.1 hypothetical protein PHACADRAFT_256443 [Phanerochaete carnosa HHB-10118-sp]